MAAILSGGEACLQLSDHSHLHSNPWQLISFRFGAAQQLSCRLQASRFRGLSQIRTSFTREEAEPSSAAATIVGREKMQEISKEAEFEQILQDAQRQDTTVVIEWMAKWCRKCIYLKPRLEKLALEFVQHTKFYYVDVNAVPQALVNRAGITKMPTIQLWRNCEKNGEIVAAQQVLTVVEELRQMLLQIESEP